MQEMEHRIARAGGHRSDDEARALNARIADLSKLLETVSAEHTMLTTQVSRLQQHPTLLKALHAVHPWNSSYHNASLP